MNEEERVTLRSRLGEEIAWVDQLEKPYADKYRPRLRAIRHADGTAILGEELIERLVKASVCYRMLIDQRQRVAPLKGSNAVPENPGIVAYYRGLKTQIDELLSTLADARMDGPISHFGWGPGTGAISKSLHWQAELRRSISQQLVEMKKHNQIISDFLNDPEAAGAEPVSAREYSYRLAFVVCLILNQFGHRPNGSSNSVLHKVLTALDVRSTGALKEGVKRWKADPN